MRGLSGFGGLEAKTETDSFGAAKTTGITGIAILLDNTLGYTTISAGATATRHLTGNSSQRTSEVIERRPNQYKQDNGEIIRANAQHAKRGRLLCEVHRNFLPGRHLLKHFDTQKRGDVEPVLEIPESAELGL